MTCPRRCCGEDGDDTGRQCDYRCDDMESGWQGSVRLARGKGRHGLRRRGGLRRGARLCGWSGGKREEGSCPSDAGLREKGGEVGRPVRKERGRERKKRERGDRMGRLKFA